jgi:myosin-crossreactive antigen
MSKQTFGDNTAIYLVGGGIASLAAAAWLFNSDQNCKRSSATL